MKIIVKVGRVPRVEISAVGSLDLDIHFVSLDSAQRRDRLRQALIDRQKPRWQARAASAIVGLQD
jgi:hypothetical protein